MSQERFPSQSDLMKNFVESIKEISFLSETWVVNWLFFLGTGMILLSVLLKLLTKIVGFWPDDFNTLVVAATLLLVLASLIRLYQYKVWREIIREQQKFGADMMRQAFREAADRNKQKESPK